MDSPSINTQFLIISDTHGMEFGPEDRPIQHADVAIHCGDLTEESKLDEYHASLRLLKDIDAPLKLVIAGNHDFTLDEPLSRQLLADFASLDPALVKREFGDFGEARQLFEEAKAAGIVFLDEGNHEFVLANGALLKVYASPYTPSKSNMAFQYDPEQGHDFTIKKSVDLVMTHGPPQGIMDRTDNRTGAGCPNLFGAVARARPRMHCFGHIHESWGAKLVAWRDQLTETPSHIRDIDNDKSVVLESLRALRPSKFDTPEIAQERLEKAERLYQRKGCYPTSHCSGDTNPLEFGTQTLFVNAAIEGTEEYPLQLPWLVNLELPRAE
ncbi:MAG: hypothetical protein Q9225_004651 [Loekoesia sp. 1 TL-2023]